MAGRAMGLNGQLLDIGYDVDINAKMDYEWETDEHPTGWNHKSDQATYTSSMYPSGTDVIVQSVSFSPDSVFIIQNEEVPFQSINKYVHPATLKQLLNPAVYSRAMSGAFQAQLDKLDPPENDYDDYSDDRDYDDRDY